MAVASSPDSTARLERNHPIWCGHFSPAERQHMLREDSTAFTSMSLVLVSIVCLGLGVIATAVAVSLFGG